MRKRLVETLVVIVLLALPGAARFAQAAEAWDLARLMEALARTKSSEARFVERKFIALLDQPVESSGELSYVAPDRLEKRTLKPKAESMTLDGNTLTLERGGRKRSLPLNDYPEVGAFVESIRGTLAGDHAALQRNYGIALEGDAVKWTLTLTPTENRMSQIVQRIRIGGSRGDVTTIEIFQADGDRSLMSIEKTGRAEKAPAS